MGRDRRLERAHRCTLWCVQAAFYAAEQRLAVLRAEVREGAAEEGDAESDVSRLVGGVVGGLGARAADGLRRLGHRLHGAPALEQLLAARLRRRAARRRAEELAGDLVREEDLYEAAAKDIENVQTMHEKGKEAFGERAKFFRKECKAKGKTLKS